MKLLYSALALAALALPASAQSYDPSLGSGNIAPSVISSGSQCIFAREQNICSKEIEAGPKHG